MQSSAFGRVRTMGHEGEKAKGRSGGPEPAPPAVAPWRPTSALTLRGLVGNQAVQRLLKGNVPSLALGDPETLHVFQSILHPTGVWRSEAQPRMKPEDLRGLITLQLPPGMDLALEPPAPSMSIGIGLGPRIGTEKGPLLGLSR
jgi:hypothetical protein